MAVNGWERALVQTMEPGDVRDVVGKLTFRASTCSHLDDLTPPPGVVIGVFPIDGGYEIFSTIIDVPNPEKVIRLETSDFRSYSEPDVVFEPPDGVRWMGPIFAESVIRKPDGSEYLMKCRGAWKPWHGTFFFRSGDGHTWTPCNDLKPGYVDHDAGFLFWDGANDRYAMSQVSYLDSPWRREPPDLLGDRWRRSLMVRTSPDGVTWTPPETVYKEQMLPPSMLRPPDAGDPPDLEFYYMQVFPWGDRFAAMVLTYAASPDLANPYIADVGVKGFRDFREASRHGAHVGTEWWVSDDPSDIHSWRRHYRDTEAAPLGFHLHHNPVPFDGRLIWCFGYKRQWYRNDEARNHMLGLPTGRIAGAFARSNAAFTTKTFTVPEKKATLNAACAFVGDRALPAERQSYVRISVLDENDQAIEGYDGCLFRDEDSTDLEMRWDGKGLEGLAGRKVALRIELRNATVFGISKADD